jgi:hypothetical protein
MIVYDWRWCHVCATAHRTHYTRLEPPPPPPVRPIVPTPEAFLAWLRGMTGPLPRRRILPRSA